MRWPRVRRTHRRAAARCPAPEGPQLRALLVQHWSSVAARVRPVPAPPPKPRERADVSSRDLLKRCEGLLRSLVRRRLRTLGLRQADIAGVVGSFDVRRYAAQGKAAALAYMLALMHWRGCSLPTFLMRPPLHPPTGLVRWVSTFSVVDQVDNGQLLLEQLVREEARVFEHAQAIVRSMQRMRSPRARHFAVLLPELLTTPDRHK